MKIFLLAFLLMNVSASSFAQQKMEGRYDAVHKIYFPKDKQYWVEPAVGGIAKYSYRELLDYGDIYRYGDWGLIDSLGNQLTPPKYKWV